MGALINTFISLVSLLKDLPPLAFRLILCYGFAEPASKKLGLKLYSPSDIIENWSKVPESVAGIASWFESLQFHLPFTDLTFPMPMPYLNALMATATENLGYILLFVGLGTRLISVPLMFVMLVAISTAHLTNGFACGNDGFEVPFYYLFMLFALVVGGPGRISLDHLIARSRQR